MLSKEKLGEITIWETKLFVKPESHHLPCFSLQTHSTWVVTQFSRRLDNSSFSIIQPLEKNGDQLGISGLYSLALTDEELIIHLNIENHPQHTIN